MYNGAKHLANAIHENFNEKQDASLIFICAGTGFEIAEVGMTTTTVIHPFHDYRFLEKIIHFHLSCMPVHDQISQQVHETK